MKAKLNKNQSANFEQHPVSLRSIKSSHLNLPSNKKIIHGIKTEKNISIKLIESSDQDINSPVPIRKISYVGPKKHSNHQEEYLNKQKNQISSPLFVPAKYDSYSSQPTQHQQQNTPPNSATFQPHEPHGILRKSMERKNIP